MVRTYQRKTNRGDWEENDMKNAILSYEKNEFSLRKCATIFCVPKDALRRRIKKIPGEVDNRHKKKLSRNSNALTEAQEEELVKYIQSMESCCELVRIKDIQDLVYQYVEYYKISHRFNREKCEAGRDFVYGFLKRHPEISLRKPEAISISAIDEINGKLIEEQFHNFNRILPAINFQPQCISGANDGGRTDKCNLIKVVSSKNKNTQANIPSKEYGNTTTILCSDAAGQYVSPLMIFKTN